MLEYPVMKKAEERALIKGFEPVFMLIGVVLLMFSIVGLFLGGPSIVKLIIIASIDTGAFVVMKFLSRDKVSKKKLNAKLFPLQLTIKGK
ncbi:MAG TPA: hypothetical protein PLH91_00450 [Tenuifilaceae bacterium]|nr:hypothetical protein [Tenuifilaceae bacterium]